jgi:predicted nucleotidyltransferase
MARLPGHQRVPDRRKTLDALKDLLMQIELLRRVLSRQPYPLLFATVSGAHLYGFPSEDSDFDLRGAHVLPTRDVLGLAALQETVETSSIDDGLEIDLVTHDVAKFFRMVLKKNGYVLEQIFSPLVLFGDADLQELREIAGRCVTRHHVHHYVGFFHTQQKLYQKEAAAGPPRVKPLLYAYRVLLTGVHLLRTGRVEANLRVLNEEFRLSYIPDLIQRKLGGRETERLPAAELDFHERELGRLLELLKAVGAASTLPEEPAGRSALSDYLVRLRLRTM